MLEYWAGKRSYRDKKLCFIHESAVHVPLSISGQEARVELCIWNKAERSALGVLQTTFYVRSEAESSPSPFMR